MKRLLAIAAITAMTAQAGATEMRFYEDAYGRPTGSSMKFGDMTFYDDAYGRPVGSSMKFGNQTFYDDAHGRPMGSSMTFGGDE